MTCETDIDNVYLGGLDVRRRIAFAAGPDAKSEVFVELRPWGPFMRCKWVWIQAVVVLLGLSPGLSAQDTALLVLRAEGAQPDLCRAGRAPQIVEVKSSAGRQVESASGPSAAATEKALYRDDFDRWNKVRLRDVTGSKYLDGALFARMAAGERLPAVPDVEPKKGASISFAEYLQMPVEGESRAEVRTPAPDDSHWRIVADVRPVAVAHSSRSAVSSRPAGGGCRPVDLLPQAGAGLSWSRSACGA